MLQLFINIFLQIFLKIFSILKVYAFFFFLQKIIFIFCKKSIILEQKHDKKKEYICKICNFIFFYANCICYFNLNVLS